MDILNKINERLKKALGEGDERTALVMRGLISEIKNKEIELRGEKKELSEEDVLEVIKKEAKKRNDALSLYEQGGRNDLAEKEKSELEILKEFLPSQMSDDELSKLIDEVIQSIEDKTNFGLVMKEVMKKVAGKADGSRVSEFVKKKLQ